MRIARIAVVRLLLPLDPPFEAAWDPVPRTSFESTIVRVETDEGPVGVGSGDTMDGFERFEHLFVGEDALDVERHARVLETVTFHAGRYWPLEAALWDLAGKAAGRPAAELFGGVVDRLPVYASCGELKPPAERAEYAQALVEEGWRALKVRIAPDRLDEGVACVRAVREAVGDALDVMVDVNQGWRIAGDLRPPLEWASVLRLAEELRELGVLWLEEPLPADDVAGHARLRAETGIRITGGEMARTRAELERFLAADALDVYQPDAVLAVGLAGARDVARAALERSRWFTPHTWTNGIGVLANLAVAAGVGAGPYLELPYDPPGWTHERRDFMLARPLRPDADGLLAVPAAPGLGVELNEEALRRFPAG